MSRRKPLVVHRVYNPDDARCVEVLLRLLKKDHICRVYAQVEAEKCANEQQERNASQSRSYQ